MSWLLLAFVLIGTSTQVDAQTIDTFAGGYTGDGGPATSASMKAPTGMAFDSNGNLYIADPDNDRVRKVDAAGVISTFAGTGGDGFSGDGGLATSATLREPWGVAVDSADNVYIADSGNSRIRKVDTNGIITTFAGTGSPGSSGDGNLATSAQLKFPRALVFDSSGALYIADTNNSRIRKVDTNGIITTFAGTGSSGFSGDGNLATSAQIDHPFGVAVDSTGNVYVSDTFNYRVRKVGTSGIITTFAGTGTSGFSGDGGPATSAQLYYVDGVGVDSTGNVYISDLGAARIRRVDTGGTITTFAGTGTQGFSGDGSLATSAQLAYPEGMAIDSIGDVYIADFGNHCVRKVATNGIIETFAGSATYPNDGGPATGAELYSPVGVATDSSGNVYIADKSNRRVRKVDTNGTITTFAGNGSFGSSGDGGQATDAEFLGLAGVTSDSTGNVYISDSNRIRKVAANGIITTFAGTVSGGYSGDGDQATSAKLGSPAGMAVDSIGNVYIADTDNNRIRKVDTSGVITTVAGNGSSGFSGDNGPATSAQLQGPQGVVVDSFGNVYIADTMNNRLRKVDTNGTITTLAGDGNSGFSGDEGPAADAQLKSPTDVAVDSIGNVYIAGAGNERIRQVATDGTITTVVGNGTAGFSGDGGPATSAELNYPQGVAVDSMDYLFIADRSNDRVRAVSLQVIYKDGFE